MNIKCKKCEIEKPQTDFYFDNGPQRYKGICKYCFVGQVLNARKKNPKKCSVAECEKPHYALSYCRQHHAQIKRRGKISDYVYFKSKATKKILKLYGLTRENYDILSKDGCNVCGSFDALILDHDHSCCKPHTGNYCGKCTRGVVCFRCNLSIAKFEKRTIRTDNPLLSLIRNYLLAYEERRYGFIKDVQPLPGGEARDK
jgi:hypothetical protein